MQRRASFFPIFILFLLLSGIVFFFAQKGAFSGLTGFFEGATVPLQRMTFGLFYKDGALSEEEKLQEENRTLLIQLAKQKEIEKENRALHDQFAVTTPSSRDLLPANIIGRMSDQIVIDKGSADAIKIGNIIIFKDNLVGKVVKVSTHQSVVDLLTHSGMSFTAETVKTETPGVIKGRGNGAVLFDNVVLSDKLEKGDVVITRGDIDDEGQGFPPDLVVGKITSVYKQPSALFQAAEIKSLIDFSKLSTVFVIIGN